jgi:hypothetical protein
VAIDGQPGMVGGPYAAIELTGNHSGAVSVCRRLIRNRDRAVRGYRQLAGNTERPYADIDSCSPGGGLLAQVLCSCTHRRRDCLLVSPAVARVLHSCRAQFLLMSRARGDFGCSARTTGSGTGRAPERRTASAAVGRPMVDGGRTGNEVSRGRHTPWCQRARTGERRQPRTARRTVAGREKAERRRTTAGRPTASNQGGDARRPTTARDAHGVEPRPGTAEPTCPRSECRPAPGDGTLNEAGHGEG